MRCSPTPLYLLALVFGLFLGSINVLSATPIQAQTSPTISENVQAVLQNEGTAPVIINLYEPVGLQPASSERVSSIAEAQQSVLNLLETGEFRLAYQYQHIPALAGEITAQGLTALQDNPLIVSVELDLPTRTDGEVFPLDETLQVLSQPNVNTFRSVYGLTGAGVTVASHGSGVDTDHLDLVENIVAEYCSRAFSGGEDFGRDCPPSNSGTGTRADTPEATNTIQYGIIGSRGYIAPKGVAPDVGLVAIRTHADRTQSAWSNNLAAYDWIIENQDQLQINIFMTGVYTVSPDGSANLYTDTCNTVVSGVYSAFDQMRQLGIALFVSAGSDGSSTGISHPGCMDNVIAVAPSYSASVGRQPSYGTFRLGCFDEFTSALTIACFANTNAMVDVVAPAYPITGPIVDHRVGRTIGASAAAAVAAGYAAQMLQANPDLTPDQIKDIMTSTGTPITDSRNSRTFPLINPEAAIDAVIVIPKGIELLNPLDHQIVTTPQVNFQWQPDALAVRYHVRLTGPSGTIVDNWYDENAICTSEVCSLTQPNLVNGSYVLEVYGDDQNRSGPKTLVSFVVSVNLATPGTSVRIEPANSFTYIDPIATIPFVWENDPLTDQYHIIVLGPEGLDVMFYEVYKAADICANGVCVLPAEKFLLNGYYQWWMAGESSEGVMGPFTKTEFRLFVPPPALPDGIDVQTDLGTPIIFLNDDPGSAWYLVYIMNTDTSATELVEWYRKTPDMCSAARCRLVPNFIPKNGNFAVYVQAWGPGGFSMGGSLPQADGWAGPVEFSLAFGIPGIAPGLTVTNPDSGGPTFYWDSVSGAAYYQLWVGTAELDTIHHDWYSAPDLHCDEGTCSVSPLLLLEQGQSYVWYVQAWGPGGLSNAGTLAGWADGGDFVVDPLNSPAAPTPLTPSGEINTAKPDFHWQSTPNVSWYNIEVNTPVPQDPPVYSMWSSAMELDCLEDNICTLEPSLYLLDGDYVWRVRGYNPAGIGTWSELTNFTVNRP